LVIRGKEWSYTGDDGQTVDGAVVVDISGEMKVRDFKVNDLSLLDPNKKEELEKIVMACFQKAQTKAQEVIGEKTKDVLGFDPSNMASMLGGGWGGMPGLS